MALAWVVGSNGLLGSALCRCLRGVGAPQFTPAARLPWGDEAALAVSLADSVRVFADRASVVGAWTLYWAAGIGTMSSKAEELALETKTLDDLTQLLAHNPVLMRMPGVLVFASSAGAIYAGSREEVITEDTAPAPTTPYARAKLQQEAVVTAFVQGAPKTSAVIARISTIYGPGQATGKQQGLMAHIARCIVRNRPIQIYVPFDTIRDYIAVDDAAGAMVALALAADSSPRVLTKIVASERPSTIAEIVSIYKRLARRTPRVVTSASPLSSLYSRRVQFRSVVGPDCGTSRKTSLLVGIAKVMAAERANFARGAGTMVR